jgi:hypothetical protein
MKKYRKLKKRGDAILLFPLNSQDDLQGTENLDPR